MKLERRIVHAPELSSEQIREICDSYQLAGLAKAGLGAEIRPPFSGKLNGKLMHFQFTDFPDLVYRFNSGEELEWRQDSPAFKKEYAQILELSAGSNLFYIHHLRSYTFPLEAFSLVVDLDSGLVTLDHARLGDYERPREVDHEFHFGFIAGEGKAPPTVLHDFTRDMDDTIIDWRYDFEDRFIVRHYYVDHLHKIDRLIREGRSTFYAAVTCDYIKIRDNIYLMSWLETYGQGVEGTALIDMASLRDVGSFFGISYQGTLDSHTFAAIGKRADHF